MRFEPWYGKKETKYTTAKLELHSKAAEENQNVATTDNLPSFHSTFTVSGEVKSILDCNRPR